jgi:anti-anti-sigma factor
MAPKIGILQPHEVLDAETSKVLFRQLNQLLREDTYCIAIDCQTVKYIDSSGLGALVRMLKVVEEAGGRFGLCSIGEQPQMMLELTDMQDVFEIFSSPVHFRLVMSQ